MATNQDILIEPVNTGKIQGLPLLSYTSIFLTWTHTIRQIIQLIYMIEHTNGKKWMWGFDA
jgi:hypothetical protein